MLKFLLNILFSILSELERFLIRRKGRGFFRCQGIKNKKMIVKTKIKLRKSDKTLKSLEQEKSRVSKEREDLFDLLKQIEEEQKNNEKNPSFWTVNDLSKNLIFFG